MNKALRRAAAATTLALTAAFAAVSGNAVAQAPAAEPMWYAVTTNPETGNLAINMAKGSGCTANGHEVVTAATINVSLSDIVRSGETADAETLNAVLMLAQMTGDDSELKAELQKYDFTKADAAKISQIFDEEWSAVSQKYASGQFPELGQELQQDIINTLVKVAQKYEQQTGVTIALEFAGGGMSPAPTPACQAKAAPKP